MKRQKIRKEPISEINITPFTDVILVILVIFMIATPLLSQQGAESKIEVRLPQGSAETTQSKADAPLVVSVNAGNEVYIDKVRVPVENLKKELAARYKISKFSGILVRADKTAAVNALVKVLDSAKQAGIQKLGVAIEQGK